MPQKRVANDSTSKRYRKRTDCEDVNIILKTANHNGIMDMVEVNITGVDGPFDGFSGVIIHKIRGNRYFHSITLKGDPKDLSIKIPTDLKEYPNRVIGFECDEPGECILLILAEPHVDVIYTNYAIKWIDSETYESSVNLAMWMQIRLLFVARLKDKDTKFSSIFLPDELFQLICKMVTAIKDANVHFN